MSFEKGRFRDYIKQDNRLIKQLKKNEQQLKHSLGRVEVHTEQRDNIALILGEKAKNLDHAMKQMEHLSKLEGTRIIDRLRTQFLLYADFVKDTTKVDKVFFPELFKKPAAKDKSQAEGS